MPSTVIISANVLFKVLALHYQPYGTFTLNRTGNENENGINNGYQYYVGMFTLYHDLWYSHTAPKHDQDWYRERDWHNRKQ